MDVCPRHLSVDAMISGIVSTTTFVIQYPGRKSNYWQFFKLEFATYSSFQRITLVRLAIPQVLFAPGGDALIKL